MSGSTGSEDMDVLAAEYVLGTLSALEAAAVEAALPGDPALAAAVAGWERRLAPLLRVPLPEAPPGELWARIEDRIAPVASTTRSVRSPSRWLQWWAGGATAAALAMAAVLVLAPQRPDVLTTAMVTDRSQTAWSVTAMPDGSLRLAAIPPAGGGPEQAVPEGRILQLWALPPGATAPTSLAVLSPGQRAVTLAAPAVRPVPGMLIELTLEPPGGSPGPRPSGPIQFIGRLPRTI